jgi:hypothetical protein
VRCVQSSKVGLGNDTIQIFKDVSDYFKTNLLTLNFDRHTLFSSSSNIAMQWMYTLTIVTVK